MANKCAITPNTGHVDWLDVFDNFLNDDHHMRALSQTQQENVVGNTATSMSGANVERPTLYSSSSAGSSTSRDTLHDGYTSTTTSPTENPATSTGSGTATAQSPPTIPPIPTSVIPPVPDPTKDLHKIPSVSATSPPSTKSTPRDPIDSTVPEPTSNTDLAPTSNTDLALIDSSETSYLEENGISAEAKALARSERKRSREKKRRCDVNAQFADLTTLLRKIEDEEGGIQPSSCNNITNRVDLISRTIRTMDKLHNENGKRRLEVEELKEKLSKAKKNVEELEVKVKNLKTETKPPVMMMVPMMYPNSSNTSGFPVMQPPSSSSPAFPMPPGQFMPQMPFGQMQSLPMYPGGVPQCFPPPMFNPSGAPLPGHVLKPESNLQKKIVPDNFSMPPKPQISTPPPNLAHCA